MAKSKSNFRFHEATLAAMDRLITNPPAIIVDKVKGAAKNRTELIEVLVLRAVEAQEREAVPAVKRRKR